MKLLLPFAAAILAIGSTAVVSVQSLRAREATSADMIHTYDLRSAVRRVQLLAADAERGQRGYLLTGRAEYLAPYLDARQRLAAALDEMERMARDDPAQAARAADARRLASMKIAELNQTIDLYRRGDTSLAIARVESGEGRQLMDQLRALLGQMNEYAQAQLEQHRKTSDAQARRAVAISIASALVLLVLAIAAALVVRGDLQRREEAARQRARIVEYQERMIGIVGHDLRNPLSAILLSSQSILGQTKNLTEGQVSALQRVRRSAARINALAGLLVDFTHARLGRGLPISKAPTDARELVERTVDELRDAYPDRTIAVESSAANAKGLWDSERLAQLVVNLVTNALRYGREATAVRVSIADGPDDAVELRVHNEGDPIPEHMLPHLFEPFRRGEGAERQHRGGLGLGLFIVREIVRAHGGTIAVESAAGAGTTFVTRLPRWPPGEAAVAGARAGAAAVGPMAGPLLRRAMEVW